MHNNMGIKLSLDTLIETILKSIDDNSFLNEISLTDKYDIEKKNGKTNLDYHTYILICQLDPTVRHHYYAGKYCNWLLQKFDVSKIRNREYKRSIRVALEQYNDGVKRGILKRHGISSDIGSFKSVEDLVSTMSNIMGGGTQMSQSASNHMDRLKGQYEIVGESENWMIVCPKTFEAERYFGSGTEWCTVANEEYFNSYRKRGDLYITVPKNMDNELKMQFHFNSQSFADFEDCVYDNPKVCIFNVLGDGKEFNEVYEMWSKRSMVFDELYKFVKISDVEGLLASGKDPYDVFDGVWYDDNGVRKVSLNNKCNLIDNKNRLLSPNMWFDGCGTLQPNECVIVRIKHVYNFLDVRTKKFLYDKPVEEWFYDVGEFFDGFALVAIRLSDSAVKYNFINGNGEFLWKKPYEEWFDFVTGFHNGYGRAQFQDVWYKIDTNGNLHDNVTNEKVNINENKNKNMTNIIKINESQLRNMVVESLNRILNEEQNVEKWLASGWHKFPDEIPEIGRKVCVADSHNNVEGHLSTPIAWDGETFRTNLAHTIRYVDVNDVTFWQYI